MAVAAPTLRRIRRTTNIQSEISQGFVARINLCASTRRENAADIGKCALLTRISPLPRRQKILL